MDPRSDEGDICGDHYTGPNNVEWICVSTPETEVKNLEGKHSHYYVRRHPSEEQ